MSGNIALLRLQEAWRECERHVYHLCLALSSLDPLFPMTGNRFENLSDAQIQSMDQFILRFTKLQDAMGNHLFPSILRYLQEPYEDQPMLDKLNRLEKLKYIQSAELWPHIRNIRNKFAHDYPDEVEKNAALINVASEAAEQMYLVLSKVAQKLERDQPDLKLSHPLTVMLPKHWITL
jgi:hypothetical protein